MTTPTSRPPLLVTRRGFLSLGVGAVAVAALASCTPTPTWVPPTGPAVDRTEKDRRSTGRVVTASLTAAAATLDLAGTSASTFSYGSIPGPVLRVRAGDTLQATVRNDLPFDTSVHWHGLALRNDMDGVPPLTQQPIAAGDSFRYEFIAPDPGTHWFHPHVGAQLDSGLYGALIVEDPNEPLRYDDEWVIILDDWLDGVTATPDEVLEELRKGMGDMGGMEDMFMRMGNMLMGADSDLLGGDAGDVYYPHYLINGKPTGDPAQFTGAPGTRVRIRLINAGGDTAFRVALGEHRLTVTHTDGYPVDPLEVDSVLIGMGERYDVIVTLSDGVFPFIAEAEGKRERAFAIVRTGGGQAPAVDVEIPELGEGRQVATAELFAAASDAQLDRRATDRTIELILTGSMAKYDWGFNGKRFDMNDPLRDAHAIVAGERVRLTVTNDTDMWHPFHLHGHAYQHTGGGPRKDTSIVLPGQTLNLEFDADNPGRWMTHCHNIYHGEAGMMTVLAYRD
ncbi:multicopper oxidase family protein [Microbacterium sp. SY138]|uniref:multicopper oxidase family protein n=1 Tax=unclassified Microbacterium TaxID=2609290 RepID=UPI003219B562